MVLKNLKPCKLNSECWTVRFCALLFFINIWIKDGNNDLDIVIYQN